MPEFDAVRVGDAVPQRRRTIDQALILRYAGASGDFNPLHWDSQFAKDVSPTAGVIAHGMLSYGLLSRALSDWAGGSDRIRRLDVAFRAPCPVGAAVSFGGEVVALDDSERTATLAVWAELEDGAKVIDRRKSRAVVQLP
ncbi:MAG TPA: MaoC/PaaZ C-terminal domain-containing protein [Egibacteraceae bacterium]|nr:MaoC/PaaZ C-terminal domain-containing protein [Egibacteraceae bacterium]